MRSISIVTSNSLSDYLLFQIGLLYRAYRHSILTLMSRPEAYIMLRFPLSECDEDGVRLVLLVAGATRLAMFRFGLM